MTVAVPDAERDLTVGDGTVIHTEHHAAVGGARGTLILLHGFSVHCGRYRQVAAALAHAGLSVTAFDCRGHGRSTGRRGYVRDFEDFLDDLDAVIQAAREEDRERPVVVMGHSHGATIALRYALANRFPLAGLVVAAPWLELKLPVPAWKLKLSRLAGRLWPTLRMGNELREQDTTRDPTVRARLAGDSLVHHVATPRWFNQVLAAQAYILDHAAALQVPTLLAVAGEDRIVSTEAALRFARAVGDRVKVSVYPDAFHELLLEPDWPRIVEDFASWVVARLSAPYT